MADTHIGALSDSNQRLSNLQIINLFSIKGVYVPLSETTPSNPYLNVPDRDVETRDGVALSSQYGEANCRLWIQRPVSVASIRSATMATTERIKIAR